jgi:hypothetical protein
LVIDHDDATIGAMEFDPDGEFARTFRRQIAAEFRTEAEDAEHDARLHALRIRTMAQVAYDAMAQGRHVTCQVGGEAFPGLIVHARSDLAVVGNDPRLLVLVNLAGPVVVRTGAVIGAGRSADPAMAGSFLGALRALEIGSERVQLSVAGTGTIDGALLAVAPDHVCLEQDASTWHVPLACIGAVRAPRPDL